jgi:hypothetical protein
MVRDDKRKRGASQSAKADNQLEFAVTLEGKDNCLPISFKHATAKHGLALEVKENIKNRKDEKKATNEGIVPMTFKEYEREIARMPDFVGMPHKLDAGRDMEARKLQATYPFHKYLLF